MIKENYTVQPIKKEECKPWLLEKHYAHRLPSISYAFGLYDNTKTLVGVITFGMPCVQMNFGKCIFENYTVDTLELNRLVVNEQIKKNGLSLFVSRSLKLLPRPLCVVSFADPNNGHHGYIYQATNWIYTGLSEKGGKNKDYILNGRNYHGKTINEQWFYNNKFNYDKGKTLYENFQLIGGEIRDFELKHRYLYFLGSKKQIKEMKRHLKYSSTNYPKGNNTRYDASKEIITQAVLF